MQILDNMSGPKRSYNQAPISQALQFNPRQASPCRWLPQHAALRPPKKKLPGKLFFLTHVENCNLFQVCILNHGHPPTCQKRQKVAPI